MSSFGSSETRSRSSYRLGDADNWGTLITPRHEPTIPIPCGLSPFVGTATAGESWLQLVGCVNSVTPASGRQAHRTKVTGRRQVA
jgi:hypothetical protein